MGANLPPQVILTTIWPVPHAGGVSSHILFLRDLLDRESVPASIVTPSEAAALGTPAAPGEGLPGTLKELGVRLGLYVRLVWGDGRPLIHAHDVAACWGILRAGVGAPVVLTVHGYLADEYVAAGAVASGTAAYDALLEMERVSYAHATEVITVDGRLAEHVKRLSGREPKVALNAVDPARFAPADRAAARRALCLPEDKFVILCPRRLTEKNGVRHAVAAIRLLVPEYKGVVLLLAGDGEQRRDLQHSVRTWQLDEYCTFAGAVPHEQMPLYYAAADVVVIPSVHAAGVEEASSIAALEAMAAGRPVVASAVGGLKEIIRPGTTGILVEPGNAASLASELRRLALHPSLRMMLGERARHHVLQNFGPERFLAQVGEVYSRAASTAAPHTSARGSAEQLDARLDRIPSQHHYARAGLGDKGVRIAFLAVHNRLTGGAKVFLEHASRLYRAGVPVAVVSPVPKPEWASIDVPWLKVPWAEVRTYLDPFDVAVAMFWTGVPAVLACDAPVKVLLEQGDPSLFEPEALPEQTRRLMDACYRAPVGIVAVSRVLADVLQRRYGRRCLIVPCAVDQTVFYPAEAPPSCEPPFTILLVGADEISFKGIRDGLEAVELLRRKGYPLQVVQVSPTGRRLYEEYRRQMVVRPRPEVLAGLYRRAHVYVNCSWYESFSLPPLEAMSCGTPVVATDNGGIREYAVGGENCLLAEPKDPASIAGQIERVLTDGGLMEKLRRAGLETARRYTWEKASEAFAAALVRWKEAFALREKATRQVQVEAYHRLAASLVASGELEVAEDAARVALFFDRAGVDTLYNMAFVLACRGKKEEALGWVEKLLLVSPDDPDGLRLREELTVQGATFA